jgi:maltooligosyltrehalose trehalohydrolase
VTTLRPAAAGGRGFDAVWNDDFHHAARVALTGLREAYYSDYRGTPQEFISLARHGYLYQGQRYAWQKQRRGTPVLGLPPAAFVNFLENHDQVANSCRGERLAELADPARLRALTCLLLLAPGTPLLFQGQEYGSRRPFLYFADHEPELAARVRAGRAEFLAQFPSLALPDVRAGLADPGDAGTFQRSKLDPGERVRGARTEALHRDLLRLRREEPLFRAAAAGTVDGAVLSPDAFVLRWFGADGDDRLLLVNLGAGLPLEPAPEPLLAPPARAGWRLLWSSEDPRYGGRGAPAPEAPDGGWSLPPACALVLAPSSEDPDA